jgi:hypothetical protein
MRLDKNGSKPAHDYEYFYEGVEWIQRAQDIVHWQGFITSFGFLKGRKSLDCPSDCHFLNKVYSLGLILR